MCVVFQGYGVFACLKFSKGDFLLEYRGELLEEELAKLMYNSPDTEGRDTYQYFFVQDLQIMW